MFEASNFLREKRTVTRTKLEFANKIELLKANIINEDTVIRSRDKTIKNLVCIFSHAKKNYFDAHKKKLQT